MVLKHKETHVIKVSIIIPTLNHLDDCLKPCCEAIINNCNLEDKEVIIAANGCTDETRKYVESLGEPFRLLWFDEPMGYARPNNEAAKIARGEYLLFLNNDCFLLPQNEKDVVINLLVEKLEKNQKIGIVGPQMRNNMETGRDFVIFYCAMMRKKLFEEFGMFDESFADGTCEDVDLCIKVADAGYELLAVTLPIHHLMGTTIKELPDMWTKLNRSAMLLGKKHNSKWYKEQISNKKVSIVIGTLNHLEDCLKPCCEAIQKYCNLDDKEVIIVANGCTDDTKNYIESLGEPFRLLWFDKPLGYSRANNEGIRVAKGEYVLLLNNDAFLIEQKKDALINMHLEHFIRNPKMGVVGPIKSFSPSAGRDFIVFFCAMIKRKLFDELGLLDEIFAEGAGEDTDFCIRAVDAGYEIAVAGQMTGHAPEKGLVIGSVPIYHKGEVTVHDKELVSNWDEIFERNSNILKNKYQKQNKKKILCAIPTKGRYFTTLPLAIESVVSQTLKPDALVIYDDGEHRDLRNDAIYQYLFKTLDDVGIKWSVTFTQGKGQHFAHQMANTSDYEYVWRLDDDTVAMPDVLEKLMSCMEDDVGAVAGSVITPGGESKSLEYATKLLDINRLPNVQWEKGSGIVEVEHLYSSFLYRANVVDYNLTLSTVAHREETIFSHRMFRAGYRLLVNRSAITYHYRNSEGGIRSESDKSLWECDEKIFHKELETWGYKFVAISHGLGDHFIFANLIPALLKRCKTLVLFCVYPEAFYGYENVECRPLGDCSSFGCKEISVYEWCSRYGWKKSLLLAMKKIHLDGQS